MEILYTNILIISNFPQLNMYYIRYTLLMKIEEKNKAIDMRKKGFSMGEISNTLGVSKASISIWVRDVKLSKIHKNRISKNGRSVGSIEKRRISRLANERSKDDIVKNIARNDFHSITKSDLKLIGIIVYLGEGGKTKRGVARIANSDPDVIKITMRFFREICSVPEEKFRGHIHTFDDANVSASEEYWSKITNIPRSQFYKTYSKLSIASKGKRQTTPHGTFEVSVNDTKLYLTIMAWIEKVKELTV